MQHSPIGPNSAPIGGGFQTSQTKARHGWDRGGHARQHQVLPLPPVAPQRDSAAQKGANWQNSR